MTNQEAIETIKANYPDERYTMLREALDMAMELLKAQEPRVMTLEEAIETVSEEGGFVWIEQKAHPLDASHLRPSKYISDCSSRRFVDYGKEFIPKKNSARFMWRCWSSWPTDEQWKAVKWDVDAAD